MDIQQVMIESLRQDPENPRTHDERNLEAIMRSLARFGQQKPIVATQDGVIIAGNGTWEAAKRLGWTQIRVVFTGLSGIALVAYGIADNKTAELAGWDEQKLLEHLLKISEDPTIDALVTGFTSEDISVLMNEVDQKNGVVDEDDVPVPPDEAVTQRGDVWVLGDPRKGHRLMCGDSADPGDVDRLLDGAVIHLVNTDPPYNVKVEPRSNNAIAAGLSSFEAKRHPGARADAPRGRGNPDKKLRAKDRPLANDFVSDEEFDRLLNGWFGNLARVLVPGGAFYIWGGYANCGNYPPVLKRHGLYFSQAVIWVKEHPVLTRKDYMGNHEWCFYGWKEGAGHSFYGPHNATDVWSVKKVNPTAMVHLTEKPVELAARAMRYSSLPGQSVLDLFGGSGSTLIAAEQTGRRAFLMELDPLYCDVIVRRWEQYTHQQAVRVEAGAVEVGGAA